MNTRLALAVLLLAATTAPAIRTSRGGDVRADTSRILAEASKHLAVDRTYAPGEKVEMVLGIGEGARLKFDENPEGVTEFLFLHQDGRVQVLYACAGESHNWTTLTDKRTTDTRTIAKDGARTWMKCATQWRPADGKAHITFLATTVSEKELQAFKEEQRRRRQEAFEKLRRPLEWDEDKDAEPIRMIMPSRDDPDLAALRTKYDLEKVVAGEGDDYDRLRRLVKWVHDRWSHTGDNTPSNSDPLTILAEAAEGKRFRCVEYSIAVAGCAQSLGMPARRLGLKRADVETAQSGAGHVVAEVWLESRKKWVFADGQWDAIPENDRVPLNAVEFQDAFARNAPGLKIRSSSNVDQNQYLSWVAPYLYYFDVAIDQRFSGPRSDHAEDQRYQPVRGAVMLIPKGAKNPTVFQITTPMKNLTYISNPKAFYPAPAPAPGD